MTAHARAAAQALDEVRRVFPFDGYVDGAVNAFGTLGTVCLQHLEPRARILDFGCGPCDKTAIPQLLGFECVGYDDFGDHWHGVDGRLDAIRAFTGQVGIDLHVATEEGPPFDPESFDMVMLHDVLEHVHDSPRALLNDLVSFLKPGGLLFITVPNAANLRKRIHLMLGRTNLPPFGMYFWSPDPWRGHVREYVRGDLHSLARYLGLSIVELSTRHHMLAKLPAAARVPFRALTAIAPGFRDTWLLLARKPAGWTADAEPRPEAAVGYSPWATSTKGPVED